MISKVLLFLLCHLRYASALAITPTATPSPQVVTLARRAAIPTFTFGPKERYTPSQTLKPEQAIEIFPTGVFEDFPGDGITVAFGPDVHKQLEEAMTKNCNKEAYTAECQQALAPILHKTDLSTHTKRVLGARSVFLTIAVVALLIAWSYQLYVVANEGLPEQIKLNNADLVQIQTMTQASSFAAIGVGPGAWATATVTMQPAATSSSPNFITVETLTANKDDHKAGDIVYRIPEDAANRIRDFLGMTGLKESQEICKGQSLKRADPTEECIRHIQRHAMDLADVGPANLMQIAQGNIPMRPAAGQAIGFPIENIAIEGIPMVIPVYRVVVAHRPRRPNFDLGWDPVILATGATALAIAAHAVMVVGANFVEIWVSKDRLVPDLDEAKLACPKDLVCVMPDCLGQQEGTNQQDGDVPYCKKAVNFGCYCHPVAYPHVVKLEHDYMDKQYEWLEGLLKRSEMPAFESKCDGGDQPLVDADKQFKIAVEHICKDQSLDSDFDKADLIGDGFTRKLLWQKEGKKKDCGFDCQTLFAAFTESDKCITGTGMQKNGEIVTECGTASYLGYNLAG